MEKIMIKKLILGFAAMLLLAACGMSAAPLATQPTAIPTFSPVSSATQDPSLIQGPVLGGKPSGDLLVWISSNPTQPIRGDNILEALVTDSKGQPITDATVSFDINMTNMNHGKNVVTASSVGGGHYRGNIFFLMPGPWRVIVSVERAGQTSTVRFDFTVNFR
jgi:YtkA-like